MRLLHKLYAHLFGYFWLSCPICGKMFGGHEIAKIYTGYLIQDNGAVKVCCPDRRCTFHAGAANAMNNLPLFVDMEYGDMWFRKYYKP